MTDHQDLIKRLLWLHEHGAGAPPWRSCIIEPLIPELKEAADALERLSRLDREAATHVESVICMKTHFTGDPPYVGWKGLGLALTEHLEKQEAEIERLKEENEHLESVLDGYVEAQR